MISRDRVRKRDAHGGETPSRGENKESKKRQHEPSNMWKERRRGKKMKRLLHRGSREKNKKPREFHSWGSFLTKEIISFLFYSHLQFFYTSLHHPLSLSLSLSVVFVDPRMRIRGEMHVYETTGLCVAIMLWPLTLDDWPPLTTWYTTRYILCRIL